MTFRERINQGSSQTHAQNSFIALAAVSCAETDVLRKSSRIKSHSVPVTSFVGIFEIEMAPVPSHLLLGFTLSDMEC